MDLEEKLSGWTGPSSPTEQEKQDRAERMVREAVSVHPAFKNCALNVYAKGSYKNNTNVRSDSDVDIAVQCTEVCYWQEENPGDHTGGGPYTGIWTPTKLRSELQLALEAKFPRQVDSSGSTAFRVHANSARVDADVVPCFDFKYYMSSGTIRPGAAIFKKSAIHYIQNYPVQQHDRGVTKNNNTSYAYKKVVRLLKRTENAMASANLHREVQSFLIECLVYNCPNDLLTVPTWTQRVRGVLAHIYNELKADVEPDADARWVEVNGCKYLFFSAQPWSRKDGRDFAFAAWNYLGLK